MADNRKQSNGTGIGICGALGIAFIVLKLIGKISWSWLWVLAPLWIPAAVGVLFLLVWLTLKIIILIIDKRTRR